MASGWFVDKESRDGSKRLVACPHRPGNDEQHYCNRQLPDKIPEWLWYRWCRHSSSSSRASTIISNSGIIARFVTRGSAATRHHFDLSCLIGLESGSCEDSV